MGCAVGALVQQGAPPLRRVSRRIISPSLVSLMLELMHFAQEVLDPERLKTPAAAELSDKEIEMAKMLVETLSSEWDPAKYEDRYQTAVRELIEAKVQNRPKTAKPLAPPIRGAGLDIVAILQESIRESAEKRKKTPARNAGRRTSTPSLKTKRRAGSLGND